MLSVSIINLALTMLLTRISTAMSFVSTNFCQKDFPRQYNCTLVPVNSWNSRFYEIRSDSELLPSSVHFLSRRKYCSHYSNNPNTVQQSRFEPSNCKYERWRTLLETSWQAGNKTSTKLPSKDTKPYETCPSRFQLFRNILEPKLHAA